MLKVNLLIGSFKRWPMGGENIWMVKNDHGMKILVMSSNQPAWNGGKSPDPSRMVFFVALPM